MKSPCAILALLPLLLLARTIESRNEPGAYCRPTTSFQPTHGPIYLRPNPSSPSHGPIILRPSPPFPAYGLIRSDPSNGFNPWGQILDKAQRQERVKCLGEQCKSSGKDFDLTMIFGDGFKQMNSPSVDSRLTPDDAAIINLLEYLQKASLSFAEATPDVKTINVDVKTPTKSFYNNFRPMVPYATPYYDDLKRASSSPVKATPDVATRNIDVKTPTPYASRSYYRDVVPKGKNPPTPVKATPYASPYYRDVVPTVKATPYASPYNRDVVPTVKAKPYASPYYRDVVPTVKATPYASPYYRDVVPTVKATPYASPYYRDVVPTVKATVKATPYASPYYRDVVPKGKNPPAQPSPWNIINWK